ncbi:MAG TPA: polysaccharide biosynthesis tyrosine autokinase [Stellaceae bacterium]|nr:polysaccharide biosynthesis tyrosine autokinase [Stellaceae bacterium]
MDGSGVGTRDDAITLRAAGPRLTRSSIWRDQFDIREMLGMLRRRRALILGCMLVLTTIAVLVVFNLKPKYTADTALLLDTRKTNVIDLQAVVSGLQPEAAAVRSEIDVLRSRQLIEKVIEKLGLVGNPDFNTELKGDKGDVWSSLAKFRRSALDWLAEIGVIRPPARVALTPAEQQQQTLMRLTDKLLDHLAIGNDTRSYTIKLSYTDENPELATQIVNTVADLYLVDQLEAKFDATKRANAWLSQQVAELRTQVNAAEQAVQTYRDQHKLTAADVKGTTITTQQLGELNSQLVLANADLAQKEARLRQFQEAMKKGTVEADAPEVLNSPLITQLRAQETEVVRKEADLSARFGPRHPAIINVRAELRDVRRQIAQEINKIVGNLAQDVQVARIRVQSLQQNLAELQKNASKSNDATVKLHELEREAQASRALYESFLTRFKETSQEEDIQQPDARVIARADVPVDPSFPNKKLFIALALLGSALIGIVIAVIAERLDNGFRAAEQVESMTGVVGLGMIPMISGRGLLRKPEDTVLRQPSSAFAESIRSVRTAILYANVDKPPRVLLVTSAVPEEGKSLISVSLARSAAKAGQKVLLIDADLRRPKIAAMLKGRSDATLPELFAGKIAPEEVLNRDAESGVDFICAHAGMPNPQDLLGSQHMRDFVRSISQHYDMVVIDSPPVLAASDSLVLSRIVDATIFIVRWEKTPRQVVLGALKQIQTVGGQIAGVVLSRVNVRKHARFGYGDHGYYYGTYKEYAS